MGHVNSKATLGWTLPYIATPVIALFIVKYMVSEDAEYKLIYLGVIIFILNYLVSLLLSGPQVRNADCPKNSYGDGVKESAFPSIFPAIFGGAIPIIGYFLDFDASDDNTHVIGSMFFGFIGGLVGNATIAHKDC